jgi:preprotein translocase subunit YajC
VFETFILAQEDTAATGAGLGNLLFLVAMVAIFWFLFIRPQRKRMKQQQDLQTSISLGDDVQTIGGIHGRIVEVGDETVVIEVEAGRLRIAKRGIASRSAAPEPEL